MRSAVSAFIVWVRAATEVPGRIMGAVGLVRGTGAGVTWAGTRPDVGESFRAGMGIIRDSKKLSLSDSSHLTAEAPAGKLEPGLLNFNTHKDCSWHVR